MNSKRLIESFQLLKQNGLPIVLATVVDTQGSTYSKPGAMMLIGGDDSYHGLLSGGCLEGDLVERAKQVVASGTADLLTYDMRNEEEDELWGFGVGCNGAISILLQKIDPKNNYEPLASLIEYIEGNTPATYSLVVETKNSPVVSLGSMVLVSEYGNENGHKNKYFQMEESSAKPLVDATRVASQSAVTQSMTISETDIKVLVATVSLIPRLLIMGGGPDVVPVVKIAEQLGWRATVVDHRSGYVNKCLAAGFTDVRQVTPETFTEAVQLGNYSGAIIMSHHLRSDLEYLRGVAASNIAYIGMLGPENRKRKLLDRLDNIPEGLGERVYGPAGLDIGAADAESIALSIVAEIHAALKNTQVKGRQGEHLGAGL